jgi:hypothetical protein
MSLDEVNSLPLRLHARSLFGLYSIDLLADRGSLLQLGGERRFLNLVPEIGFRLMQYVSRIAIDNLLAHKRRRQGK